jgi:hypothetical protein
MLLIGVDHPIHKKIAWSEKAFNESGKELLTDKIVSERLIAYKKAIDDTWEEMKGLGVLEVCTDCAINGGGSCCGAGIENRFDGTLLLINLLMGARLPKKRPDVSSCFFLGENGCTIPARHTICINYICKRLKRKIGEENLKTLGEMIIQESDASFLLEDAIKRRLLQK